jgi:hypothetical protein
MIIQVYCDETETAECQKSEALIDRQQGNRVSMDTN